MNKFEPHPTYEGLLKQARALYLLCEAMEKTKSFQAGHIDSLERQIVAAGHGEIEAQRRTNEFLSNEIERLERELAIARGEL